MPPSIWSGPPQLGKPTWRPVDPICDHIRRFPFPFFFFLFTLFDNLLILRLLLVLWFFTFFSLPFPHCVSCVLLSCLFPSLFSLPSPVYSSVVVVFFSFMLHNVGCSYQATLIKYDPSRMPIHQNWPFVDASTKLCSFKEDLHSCSCAAMFIEMNPATTMANLWIKGGPGNPIESSWPTWPWGAWILNPGSIPENGQTELPIVGGD